MQRVHQGQSSAKPPMDPLEAGRAAIAAAVAAAAAASGDQGGQSQQQAQPPQIQLQVQQQLQLQLQQQMQLQQHQQQLSSRREPLQRELAAAGAMNAPRVASMKCSARVLGPDAPRRDPGECARPASVSALHAPAPRAVAGLSHHQSHHQPQPAGKATTNNHQTATPAAAVVAVAGGGWRWIRRGRRWG